MLHKSLSAASLILIKDQGKLATQSYVARVPEKLREWSKWSEEARPYLDALDNTNSLKALIDAYRNKVMNLEKWLGTRLGVEHSDAFKELCRLEDRIREIDPNWKSGYGVVYTMKSSGP